MSDIFSKTGVSILLGTKIPEPDYMILINYLDLIDDINKKIKDIEAQIDKRLVIDKDIELLKTIPGLGNFTAFIHNSFTCKKQVFYFIITIVI